MTSNLLSGKSNRQGATIFMMLILLVVVFVFVAFAIDLGRVQLAQLKLQTASDFATRAGAEAMSRGVGDDPMNAADVDSAVRDEVEMLMIKNSVFGAAINFDKNVQIEFGEATRSGAKFSFNASGTGNVDSFTNALRVNPDLNQFPMFFGSFTGRNALDLGTATTAKVGDRDIVIVVDRSSSMFDHDAGTMTTSEYNSNLRALEDLIYGSSDSYFPGNANASALRHSEFDVAGGVITLSRIQALKLAILKFRDEIDKTRAREKLGLVAYAVDASHPSDVTVDPPSGTSPISIGDGLSTAVRDAIVDNEQTESTLEVLPHEEVASALESDSTNYRNFDFQYLRTRCMGNTNIADGILAGADILYGPGRRNFATPILIVMTDGRHNQASTPEAAANTVMANHPDTLIYTVTFGDGAEQAPMQTVADVGNGEHIHASDADELVDAFRNLATNAGVTMIE
jgi:Flp pilus assembly protein TadG